VDSTKPRARFGTPRKQYPGKFGAFVSSFLAENLAIELDLDPTNVYAWLNGRQSPRIRHAIKIVEIARRSGTKLTLQDVYHHEIKSFQEGKQDDTVLSGSTKEDRNVRLGAFAQRAG
jgi:hypothetical protein